MLARIFSHAASTKDGRRLRSASLSSCTAWVPPCFTPILPSPTRNAPSAIGYSNYMSYYNLRSEEHTSELQSLLRTSYAVFCLKKKKNTHNIQHCKHETI